LESAGSGACERNEKKRTLVEQQRALVLTQRAWNVAANVHAIQYLDSGASNKKPKGGLINVASTTRLLAATLALGHELVVAGKHVFFGSLRVPVSSIKICT
jgi:hypothetical protein